MEYLGTLLQSLGLPTVIPTGWCTESDGNLNVVVATGELCS